MLNTDEDAVICDLAEVYGIFNYRSLPLSLVATLTYGLGQDSRIGKQLNKTKFSVEESLLMHIADRLSILVWLNSEDGQKGINYPDSFFDIFNDDNQTENNDILAFDTVEDFEAEREAILRRSMNG